MRREVHINGQVWTGVYRCGASDEDGRWISGGFLLDPAPDGSLPPANEAGADPVEVRAAEIAAHRIDSGHLCSLSLDEFLGWRGFSGGKGGACAGWLAREICEGDEHRGGAVMATCRCGAVVPPGVFHLCGPTEPWRADVRPFLTIIDEQRRDEDDVAERIAAFVERANYSRRSLLAAAIRRGEWRK